MGFTREELEAVRGESVPDLVGDEVGLLFVGINPSLWTAAAQAHFAHPSNRFYKALHAAGVVDRVLDVSDGFDEGSEDALTGRGIAITNLVNRATARAAELGDEELVEGARTLGGKVAVWDPDAVAFVGLGAYRTAYDRPGADVGRQDDHEIAGVQVWALPNPSGLNAHYRLDDLARWYRRAAEAAGVDLDPPRG
ncbi:MAG: mismatch-specific DNA-glycosylase [Gemmatimonadota bacterium]|nr:mismatch-specific DNA-glycosylase [Gemmatimonadota bacterium]